MVVGVFDMDAIAGAHIVSPSLSWLKNGEEEMRDLGVRVREHVRRLCATHPQQTRKYPVWPQELIDHSSV